RGPDTAVGRTSTVDAPAEHFHAVGQLFVIPGHAGAFMHCLAVASAAQMRKSRARDQAARRLVRMIDCRENFTIRAALINGVVRQHVLARALVYRRLEADSTYDSDIRRRVEKNDY